MQTDAAADHRSHEVRIGMSVYWVRTWPDEGGFGYAGSGGLAGRTSGTRRDAVADARAVLRAREAGR